ncbi:Membrane protease YdiL, CAAX protease family [Halogranum amylolyticum]|uniref:Membrane protease YdiL, CAAX protease family n=1 Tax=Halogranum amylolyticum TaxID=660520 RepID=A0A1H8PL31_9EURY|nr:CPBP family intramembrane glutamic endopeptidase [Halogranum amylolyticum]SEO42662.1 Membrane protease YdiL, CAAX protease family [Halogranum amylolyticum]
MTNWAAFAGFAGVVLGLLLLLAHASKEVFSNGSDDQRRLGFDPERPLKRRRRDRPDGTTPDGGVTRSSDAATGDSDGGWEALDVDRHHRHRLHAGGGYELSTTSLLVNVALSQGLFGAFLVVGAWYTEIPLDALGLGDDGVSLLALALGVGLGAGLYAVNEVGAAFGERLGVGSSEELREALAPDSAAGWAVLLLLVLPVIAGFEELLFRAALVGVVAAGFGVSPWLLAVLSSVAFALGHGAQGPGGIFVTGMLGFVLAAAFVLTESLLVVVVAHYLVNALEFVVHEGFGIDWV